MFDNESSRQNFMPASRSGSLAAWYPDLLTIAAVLFVIAVASLMGSRTDQPLLAAGILQNYPLEELRKLHIADSKPIAIKHTLTVKEAYAHTSVDFVGFAPEKTKMPKDEAKYLKTLFDLVNIGTVERITLMNDMNTPEFRKSVTRNHQEILRRLKALPFPPALERVHLLIESAVVDEKVYFDQLIASPKQKFDSAAPLVISADRKLRAAYSDLITIYADEDEKTRASFYSGLCALSFI